MFRSSESADVYLEWDPLPSSGGAVILNKTEEESKRVHKVQGDAHEQALWRAVDEAVTPASAGHTARKRWNKLENIFRNKSN